MPHCRQLSRAREILFASDHDVSGIDEVIQQMSSVKTGSTKEKPPSKRPRVDSVNEAIHEPQGIPKENIRPRAASRDLMPPPELPLPIRRSNNISQPYTIPHLGGMISPSLISTQEPYRFHPSSNVLNPSNHFSRPSLGKSAAQFDEIEAQNNGCRQGVGQHCAVASPGQHDFYQQDYVINRPDVESNRSILHTNGMLNDSRLNSNYTTGYAHGQISPVQTPQRIFSTPQPTRSSRLQPNRFTQPGLIQFPQYSNNLTVKRHFTAPGNQPLHQYSSGMSAKPQYSQPHNQPLYQYTDQSNFKPQFAQPQYHSFNQASNHAFSPAYNDGELDRQQITTHNSLPARPIASPFFPTRKIHNHSPAVPPITPQRPSGLRSHIHSSTNGFNIQSLPPDAVVTNVTSPFFGKKTTFAGRGTERNRSSRRRVQR